MSQLKVNSIIPVAGVPTGGGGGIIQIKDTIKTSSFSTTTTGSIIDVTGVSVSITPTSSSSKIFVMCSGEYGNDNSDSFAHLFISRTISGGSVNDDIFIGDASGSCSRASMNATLRNGGGSSNNVSRRFACQFIDSPSTTSAVEYKLRIRVRQGTPATIGRSADTSDNLRVACPTVITVMEVSA
tara:strand:+ start:53 stop:604 length:552 start_codon:yes stop_codon:yes gene_type:complete